MKNDFILVLTAAGKSERFNLNSQVYQKKEFIELDNYTVLEHAALPFLDFPSLRAIVITYPNEMLKETIRAFNIKSNIPFYFVEGGESRTLSVKNALLFIENNLEHPTLVAIHDGARPFITKDIIEETLLKAEQVGAAAPALKIRDSLKGIDENGNIIKNLDRKNVIRIQTPQIFSYKNLSRMYFSIINESYDDDMALYIENGGKAISTKGSEKNKKITVPSDLED